MVQACPLLIALNNCSNITIDQINLMNGCGNVQSYTGCKELSVSGVTVKSTAVKGSKGLILAGCNGVKLTSSFFETSGEGISSDGTSKNLSVVNCKNTNGKKLQVKN